MRLVLVQTAFESERDALSMAREIITGKRAACVQVSSPVQSVYCWDNAIQNTEEFILTAKVPESRADALQTWIEQHHNYDTPEILRIDAQANPAYMDWAAKMCG